MKKNRISSMLYIIKKASMVNVKGLKRWIRSMVILEK
jgi:hypothetical protein